MREPSQPNGRDPGAGAWVTPAESSGYQTTPDYVATLRFFERLAEAFPNRVRVESFGRSGEGRDLPLVIVSQDGTFEPTAARARGRVVLLIQNCIHAGESDGKDASMALVRDLVTTERRESPLERVVLVIIPIYNVDGHERRSEYNRINQNGPARPGWRANGTNLNLNRDYLKADAPETRALLRLIGRWRPDFFVDNHVTDGSDFQYDVTFMMNDTPDVAPATAAWIRDVVTPALARHVEAGGHAAFSSQIFLRDETDPSKGLVAFDNPPRFSTGYMILENRPGLLVEMHMLKDYRTRVTGNLLVLEAAVARANEDADRLIALNRAADAAASSLGVHGAGRFPLIVTGGGETSQVEFRGVAYTRYASPVSGALAVRYGTKPWTATLPMETGHRVTVSVDPPAGYIVPAPWTAVQDVLAAHGVDARRTTRAWTGRVGMYRLADMVRPDRPFEGRYPILAKNQVERAYGQFGTCHLEERSVTFPPGSAVYPLDHRLSKVVVHWLEPEAPDSALRWGFFDTIFEQKESGEAYVIERWAEESLSRDPTLRGEFERRVAGDPAFAGDPSARLEFLYARSPWGKANAVGEYPVGRLSSLEGLPLG